jgi:hypothetical protein
MILMMRYNPHTTTATTPALDVGESRDFWRKRESKV